MKLFRPAAKILHGLAFKLDPNAAVTFRPVDNGYQVITHNVALATIRSSDIDYYRKAIDQAFGPNYDLSFDKWWKENRPKPPFTGEHSDTRVYTVARQAWNDRGKMKG